MVAYFQIVRTAYDILRPVLRITMTDDILTSAKTDVDGSMYLDNFLGDDDVDIFNRSLVNIKCFLLALIMAVLLDLNHNAAFQSVHLYVSHCWFWLILTGKEQLSPCSL